MPPPASGTPEAPGRRRVALAARVQWLVRAIRDSDDAAVEEAVLRLSRSRRLFAPLALAVGAVVMLFEGLKLLFSNWRLTLIQVLPAMWIWAAMYDLKAHVFYGKTYHVVQGPARIPIVLAITAITMASFFLNAVFAFAIAQPGPPLIRPAFREARSHLAVVLSSGAVVGLRLGLLMLGSRALFIPVIVVFLAGLTLQAGTTSAVKAVKLGAKLITGRTQLTDGSPPPRSAPSAARD